MSTLVERVGATIVRNVVPPEMLLLSKLGEWYNRSESHKYHTGDVLVLRGNYFGFGVRPVAVVREYGLSDDTKQGFYQVTMYAGRLEEPGSDVVVRAPKNEKHFKWNMEFSFTRVPIGVTPQEALRHYKGRKATWGSIIS